MADYNHGIQLVYKLIQKIFPEVEKELNYWKKISSGSADDILRYQASLSIGHKRFHAQGGAIYALYPNVDRRSAVKFIVSLQTISDYLDNLCDRTGVADEKSFKQLHLSISDAVELSGNTNDYYLYYPYKNDNNYLNTLVKVCREQLLKLPSYHVVSDSMKNYAKLYSDLQTYKHLPLAERENRLDSWAAGYLEPPAAKHLRPQAAEHSNRNPEISAWEFSAATGSTLGIFMLYAAASDPSLQVSEVSTINSAYFPWICGLHILLDYYIDFQEDSQMGDLNFMSRYDDMQTCEDRISFFIKRSLDSCKTLRYPEFHTTIIKGLLAMYLSDRKAYSPRNRQTSLNLIKKGGSTAALYHRICKILRLSGML